MSFQEYLSVRCILGLCACTHTHPASTQARTYPHTYAPMHGRLACTQAYRHARTPACTRTSEWGGACFPTVYPTPLRDGTGWLPQQILGGRGGGCPQGWVASGGPPPATHPPPALMRTGYVHVCALGFLYAPSVPLGVNRRLEINTQQSTAGPAHTPAHAPQQITAHTPREPTCTYPGFFAKPTVKKRVPGRTKLKET